MTITNEQVEKAAKAYAVARLDLSHTGAMRAALEAAELGIKSEQDAIYSAYLGICALQTMCRKAGLAMGEQRSKELLVELGTAFPFIPERVARSALRMRICERCEKPTADTIQSGEKIVCRDCAMDLAYDDLRASGGIVGAP